jgi:hypothetical protein
MNLGREETGYLKDKKRKGWIVVLRDNARDQNRNGTKGPKERCDRDSFRNPKGG